MALGTLSFPGIISPQWAIATRTTGARPDVCIIFAQLQDTSPDTSGQATLQFGFDSTTVTWTGCLCDRGSLRLSQTGHVNIFEVLDKRWYWARCYITQAYNVRNPDGTIDPLTQRSLQAIVADLLALTGQVLYDVSLVSTIEYPELVYEHDNCADALDDLLPERGYVLSLNYDDSVTVWPKNLGNALPINGDICNAGMTLDPPEIPYYLTVVGDKTLCQSKLKCQPMALELDGSIVPAGEVSYAPAGGWAGKDMENFNFITDPKAKQCAKQSVGRWFQVVSQADDSLNINYGGTNYAPGELMVTSVTQYLPLEKTLLEVSYDVFGTVQNNLPYVEGTFYNDGESSELPKGVNTPAFTLLPNDDWKLVPERGLVIFDGIALKQSSGTFTFADVFLTCAYSVHGNQTFVKDHFVYSNVLGGLGIDLTHNNEFQRQIILSYQTGSGTVSGVNDNAAGLSVQAQIYLNNVLKKYATQVGNQVLYRGIYQFNNDGINLRVWWDIAVPGYGSIAPFGTHVSQNIDGFPTLPTADEKAIKRKTKLGLEPQDIRRQLFRRNKRKVKT